MDFMYESAASMLALTAFLLLELPGLETLGLGGLVQRLQRALGLGATRGIGWRHEWRLIEHERRGQDGGE